MRVINNYATENYKIYLQRVMNYLKKRSGYYKDFRLNHAGDLKELPDDVLILTEYSNQTALRYMDIHEDIILHSIYIKHPELFEY